jgi:hypothetical protein
LSSYKLVQFLHEYIQENCPDIRDFCGSPEDVQDVICLGRKKPRRKRAVISSRTARRWLNQLGFSWRDIRKGVFFDGHERDDVVEYRRKFLEDVYDMLPYMVEFNADGTMQPKEYPQDCCVGGPGRRPVIFITHDESIFSANDGRHQAWIPENGTFLRPKGKGKGIMVSDFLLPWSRLNLLSLPKERQSELAGAGVPLEAVEFFEYGKEEGHWDGQKLLEQVGKKALPIAEALYPGYQFVFFFDNATSHSIYAEDALRVAKMNKGEGGQQPLLRNGWYQNETTLMTQEMFYREEDSATGVIKKIPKGIQKVLEERELWPNEGMILECPKPRCESCSKKCKDCTKGTRCESCKERKVHSSSCTPKRSCDNCERRKQRCRCVQKQICALCKRKRKEECAQCQSLPPKCDSES